jgi:hypothetical protein
MTVTIGYGVSAQVSKGEKALLLKKYNLTPVRSKDTQYYVMGSRLLHYMADGTRGSADIYRLSLRCVPGDSVDEYTCMRFTIQSGKDPEISIPALANWKYVFSLSPTHIDENGQVLGIDHSRFENLTDSSGKPIPIERLYHVYNAFIDFHSMSVFAEKTVNGKGIQDLSAIGDKVIHSASFSNPPVDLGSMISKGSVFRNGEITLEFKGIGVVNQKTCAILQYDSGESSFLMLFKPFPNMDAKASGSSHYWGDIFKDLETGWLQKATLNEIVVSETTLSGQPNKIQSAIERSIHIQNIRK